MAPTSINRSISDLHPKMQVNIQAYLTAATKAGFKVAIGETRRSVTRQQYLYSTNTPQRWVTNCDGVKALSMHQYGLAVDLLLYKADGKTLDWDMRRWRSLYAAVPPSKFGMENIPQELLHVQLAGSQAQVVGAGKLNAAYCKASGLLLT